MSQNLANFELLLYDQIQAAISSKPKNRKTTGENHVNFSHPAWEFRKRKIKRGKISAEKTRKKYPCHPPGYRPA